MRLPVAPGADSRALDSVLRAVDFVEERLGEGIGVEDMARAAFFSPFYFSRLFVQATGHSPYDYLMRRRVAAAAEALVGGERSLTSLALDFGFEAPDSFTRAFRRCFGLLPSEARRTGSYPRRIARTRIVRDYAETLLASPLAPPGRMEAEDFLLGSAAAAREPGAGLFEIVERDDGLGAAKVFRGSLRGQAGATAESGAPAAIPPYPGLSTRVPGGSFARFGLPRGTAGLGAAVEFAYRAWLPAAGRIPVPSYDLVEHGADGPVALWLPLGPDSSR